MNEDNKARESLMGKLKEEKEELKKVSDKRDGLLKAFELQLTSLKLELETANKR